MQRITTGTYIIGSATAEGIFFARQPYVYYTENDAKRECKRLAEITPGKTYFGAIFCGGAHQPTSSVVTF